MALFAAIGDRFIAKILRQVASDYNLDFDEMKSRYCGDTSFELSEPVKKPVVLELPAKVSKPKVDEPKALQALSKMKKPDLVRECEERDLDSEGTVAQLKDRIKEARTGTVKAPPAKSAPKPKKEKSPPPPPPPPAPLEEEPGEECEDEAEEDDLQARLRKILAEAEEDEFDDEGEDLE